MPIAAFTITPRRSQPTLTLPTRFDTQHDPDDLWNDNEQHEGHGCDHAPHPGIRQQVALRQIEHAHHCRSDELGH